MRWGMWLIVVGFCGPLGAQTRDAWRATDLNAQMAKSFISDEKCHSNARYLLSCQEAVRAASALSREPIPNPPLENFDDLLNQIAQELPPDVPVQMMLATAINAHLRVFDVHAHIAPNAKLGLNSREPVASEGITLESGDGTLWISDVADNSPAQTAGLHFGDVLLSAAAPTGPPIPLRPYGLEEALTLLQALAQHPLKLSVERAGQHLVFTLGPATRPSLTADAKLLPQDPTIAYIRLRQFVQGQTCTDVSRQLERLERAGAKSWLLDLRDNPGGSLPEAVCIASLFLGQKESVGTLALAPLIPETELIHAEDPGGPISWQSGLNLVGRSAPLVVLVNSGTASAAEVLAGSLQSHQAAWLVGSRTFGKGTVQTVSTWPGHPTLQIVRTSARYYFRNGFSNQRVGISPSFGVPSSPSPAGPYESDVFADTLPAVNEPWFDTRDAQISSLKSRVARGASDLFWLEKLEHTGHRPDPQLAYAVAVLKCGPR